MKYEGCIKRVDGAILGHTKERLMLSPINVTEKRK